MLTESLFPKAKTPDGIIPPGVLYFYSKLVLLHLFFAVHDTQSALSQS